MPISFQASDKLTPTVVAVLAQHPDRTVAVLNYTLEVFSPGFADRGRARRGIAAGQADAPAEN